MEYDALPSNPRPVLESLFPNTPTSREIAEAAEVSSMLRKSQRVFIVIEVKFADLVRSNNEKASQV